MPAGRAMLTPGVLEAQVALMSTDPSGPGQVAVLGQLAEHANRRAADVPADRRPFRVESLPASVAYADVAAGLTGQLPPLWTLIGVGGDELDPVGVDLAEEGPAFVIAGPARSGRSTALLTMARSLRDRGTPVVAVATRRSPLRGLAGEPGVAAVFGADDGNALAELLVGTEQPVVVLVDDVTAFAESPLEEVLAGLARPHGDSPHALVIAGSSDEMSGIYRGVTVEARRNRCGLLLAPTSALDGDLLGVKLPRGLGSSGGMVAQAGRGMLALRGALTTVQVAR
jgi:S-DNA-T family DNA segregation ATPase FtsK/SpoIIIE